MVGADDACCSLSCCLCLNLVLSLLRADPDPVVFLLEASLERSWLRWVVDSSSSSSSLLLLLLLLLGLEGLWVLM